MSTLTSTDRALLAKALIEAAGKERQLHTALQVQIAAAQTDAIQGLLEGHFTVTERQIEALDARLKQLTGGGHTLAPSNLAAQATGRAVGLANRTLALAKGPLQLLRGTSPADRQLRDLRDCYWNEAEEIAHYRVIESLAEQLGDQTTADLARRHRAEEEEMQSALEELLPVQISAVISREGGSPKTPRSAANATSASKSSPSKTSKGKTENGKAAANRTPGRKRAAARRPVGSGSR